MTRLYAAGARFAAVFEESVTQSCLKSAKTHCDYEISRGRKGEGTSGGREELRFREARHLSSGGLYFLRAPRNRSEFFTTPDLQLLQC